MSKRSAMGEFDLSLIREFRSRPGFYDRNSPLFKDKVYNAREWQQIANKLGYDVSLLKDRMLQLRNRYNLEKRRLEQFHDENPGKRVDSPWPLFEELHFLSEHIRARRSYKRLLPVKSSTSPPPSQLAHFDGSQERLDTSFNPLLQQPEQQQQQPQQHHASDIADEEDQLQQHHQQEQLQLPHALHLHQNQEQRQQHFFQQQQQYFNNHHNDSGDLTADACHTAARFAANGLLAVKMEEEDGGDCDETQPQNLTEDNFEPNGGETEPDVTIHTPIQRDFDYYAEQQRKQKLLHYNSGSDHMKKKHSHKHAHKAFGAKRLYLPSIHSTGAHKDKHLPKQQQKKSAHVAGAAAPPFAGGNTDVLYKPVPRVLNAREQKYINFGCFMSSALMEIPQPKALMLLEKFTSEVVKVMLQKHASNGNNASGSSNVSNSNGNDIDNGSVDMLMPEVNLVDDEDVCAGAGSSGAMISMSNGLEEH